MEENGRPSFRCVGGERKLEIVSGRGYCSNQIYGTADSLPPPATWRPNSRTAAKPWGFSTDPETKRKKRIAKYKVYTVEGRVKASIRNGFRWIKTKCSELIHGY